MALVLTRKEGQSIKIGPDITITVKHIASHQVKISIDAPRSVNILRDDAIHKEARHE